MSDIDVPDLDQTEPAKTIPDEDEPIKSNAEKRGLTREEAIEEGKKAARLECIQLQKRRPDVYTDQICAERVIRAGEYAAWEYDGRLAGTIGRQR